VAQVGSFLSAVVGEKLPGGATLQLDGEFRVEGPQGPQGPIEILRDASGVPHCFAQNSDDAFFALGFVHGQDRAWQMEFYRRATAGRMSEITGPKGLPTDRFMRHVGIHRAAEQAWDAMLPEVRDRFVPYVNGVNAAFASSPRPLEMRVLNYQPEPWRGQDSVLWAKMLSFMLTPAWEAQILRARLIEVAGLEAVRAIDPGYPADAPVHDPPGAPYGALTTDLTEAYQGIVREALFGGPGLGSNNWVVAPEQSDTGRALLACDPHLNPVAPANGYMVHLDCPEFTVSGASVPGLPGVIWGFNRHIAWGPTAGLASVQDVVVEHFENGSNRYRTSEGSAEAEIVEENIEVRGHPLETHAIRITRNGPVISPQIPGVPQALALRSPILDAVTSGAGLVGLFTASNVDEFRQAIAGFEDYNLAFGYADVEGHIGLQTSGRIPRRNPGTAWLPLPGWDAAFDRDPDGGLVPFEELPHVFDPPGGIVWSANNAPAPIDALPFAGEFLDGYRARRIGEGVVETLPHSVDAARGLQVDRRSLPMVQLAGFLATVEPADERDRGLLAEVAAWDGVMSPESVPAAVVAVTFARLFDQVLRAKLGDAVELYFRDVHAIPNLNMIAARGASLVIGLLESEPDDWFGAASSSVMGHDIWLAALTRAFRDGVQLLRDRLGSDTSRWTWGRCHQLTLRHGLHDEPATARLLDLGPFPFGGDANTVFQAGTISTDPFVPVTAIPALRLIIEMTDPPTAEFALAGGQSERLGDRHHHDLLDDWREGRTRPLLTERSAVEAVSVHRLKLIPG